MFAIKWGYQPIPGATSADAEKKTLDEWARLQDQTPWLRFSTSNSAGSDPGELTEAVGDADAIQATTLGLKNLQRVGGMLLTATVKPGEPYDDLQLAYTRLLGQWVLEMNHVSAIVGGFDSQEKYGGQSGVLFTPVPKARQVAAVQFLNVHAFQTPAFLVQPDVLRRIEPAGALIASGPRSSACWGRCSPAPASCAWSSARPSTEPAPTARPTSSPTSAVAFGPSWAGRRR